MRDESVQSLTYGPYGTENLLCFCYKITFSIMWYWSESHGSYFLLKHNIHFSFMYIYLDYSQENFVVVFRLHPTGRCSCCLCLSCDLVNVFLSNSNCYLREGLIWAPSLCHAHTSWETCHLQGYNIKITCKYRKTSVEIRALSQYKDRLFRYSYSHYKDKTVMRLSYLYNGNLYIDKMTSLYWDPKHPRWSYYCLISTVVGWACPQGIFSI